MEGARRVKEDNRFMNVETRVSWSVSEIKFSCRMMEEIPFETTKWLT